MFLQQSNQERDLIKRKEILKNIQCHYLPVCALNNSVVVGLSSSRELRRRGLPLLRARKRERT